ncbi:MAG: flagellar protein FliT [Gammaproteobacteria bacterium]|nr:flagellar protein FliT [Gammaproteobacteria bacterium]
MTDSKLLSSILSLSKAMLAEAEKSEWEQVAEMQLERQQMIESCFPLDDSIKNPEAVKAQIQAIIEQDELLMALAKPQHKEIGSVLSKISQGKQATKSYQQVEGR